MLHYTMGVYNITRWRGLHNLVGVFHVTWWVCITLWGRCLLHYTVGLHYIIRWMFTEIHVGGRLHYTVGVYHITWWVCIALHGVLLRNTMEHSSSLCKTNGAFYLAK